MRKTIRAGMRACSGFIQGWHKAAVAGYRRQHGLFAALPIVWGCLDTYLVPHLAPVGFLASAWFLEGRMGRRLAWQAFCFLVWSLFLATAHPDARAAPAFPDPSAGSNAVFDMTGRVSGFPSQKRLLTFSLAGDHGTYRVQTEAPDFPIQPGQRLRGRFQSVPAAPATNPGQFDYPAYLRSQNLDGILKAESLVLIAKAGWFDRLILFLHTALEDGLTRSVPKAQAPLLRAALLGDTDGLDPALVEDFKASGMLHILAISGQHVGIFALILLQLFALVRLPRKAAFVFTGAVLALYVPICGGQISVLRAAVMFWSCLPAVLWERPAFAVNNLGWAAAACLICMPYQILSLGFQLSFAATFFLILYSRPMAAVLKRLGIDGALAVYFISTPLLSIVIYLGVYPILASAVHAAAPSSILGNLATVGISSGMLVSACLTLLFQPVSALASCFGESAGALASLLAASVHVLARWPGAALSVPSLPLIWSLVLLFLVCSFPFAIRTGRGLPLALLGAALFSGRWFCAQAMEAWRVPASVTYLDVGQGDGAVCALPGAVILIDAGPPEAGRNVILPYLREQGINRLEMAIVTHPDLDHYGGLAYVAEHIAIGKVICSGEDADTHAWKDLRECLAKRGVPMEKAARGQGLYACRGVTLSVLSPEYTGQFPDRNENSVVTFLQLRGRRFLFTGDMGPMTESRLLDQGDGRMQGAILKVPHHGSDLSNTLPFLDAVRPPIAILSAGRQNRFGHPGTVTVAELKRLDARIFLTARDGAVTYACDRGGETWIPYLEPGSGGPVDVAAFAGRANNSRHARRGRPPIQAAAGP